MDITKIVDYWGVKLDGTNAQKDQAVHNQLISTGYIRNIRVYRRGQSKMDNPEKQALHVTQVEGKQNKNTTLHCGAHHNTQTDTNNAHKTYTLLFGLKMNRRSFLF